MGRRLARKFAEHLDADSTDLLIANRVAAMKRAIEEKDAPAILTCATVIVESVEDQEFTAEELLNRLLNATLEFAEKIEASLA